MSKSQEGKAPRIDPVHDRDPEAQTRPGAEDWRRQNYSAGRESYREYPQRTTEGRTPTFNDRSERRRYGHPTRSQSSRYEEERSRGPERRRYEDRGRYEDRAEGHENESYPEAFVNNAWAGGFPAGYANDAYPGLFQDRRMWREGNVLRCGDIMSRGVTTCTLTTPIREVADKMEDDDIGSIPVVENGRLVGIVTDRDIVCRVVAEELDTRSSTAAEAMTEDIVTCTIDESVIGAVNKMAEFMIRRIPVVDYTGKLRGVISVADIALEAEMDQELARALGRISRPTPNQSRQHAGPRRMAHRSGR